MRLKIKKRKDAVSVKPWKLLRIGPSCGNMQGRKLSSIIRANEIRLGNIEQYRLRVALVKALASR